jgi:hypothetical protein
MSRCKGRFFICRHLSFACLLAMALAAIYLVKPYLDTRGVKGKYALMLGAFIILSPAIVIWMFLPPRFDITLSGDNVVYEFASRRYAEEFRELNARHVVKSDV